MNFDAIIDLLNSGTIKIEIQITLVAVEEKPQFIAECECGWSRGYNHLASRDRGLRTHRQHCTFDKSQVQVQSDEDEPLPAWMIHHDSDLNE